MAYHAYLQRNHQIWLINNTVHTRNKEPFWQFDAFCLEMDRILKINLNLYSVPRIIFSITVAGKNHLSTCCIRCSPL